MRAGRPSRRRAEPIRMPLMQFHNVEDIVAILMLCGRDAAKPGLVATGAARPVHQFAEAARPDMMRSRIRLKAVDLVHHRRRRPRGSPRPSRRILGRRARAGRSSSPELMSPAHQQPFTVSLNFPVDSRTVHQHQRLDMGVQQAPSESPSCCRACRPGRIAERSARIARGPDDP